MPFVPLGTGGPDMLGATALQAVDDDDDGERWKDDLAAAELFSPFSGDF